MNKESGKRKSTSPIPNTVCVEQRKLNDASGSTDQRNKSLQQRSKDDVAGGVQESEEYYNES